MALKATVVAVNAERFDLGEGPHWDSQKKKLYMVDAFVGDFVAVDVANNHQVEKVHFDDIVTFILPYSDDPNKFIVSKGKSICELDWTTRDLQELAVVERDIEGTRFNDGKCDARGRLWAGTMGLEGSTPGVVPHERGSLYSYDGSIVKQVDKVSLSNGLAWTSDEQTMFYVDSTKRHVYSFNYDAEHCSLSNQQIMFDFNTKSEIAPGELPDGMTIDTTGKIWLACYDGGRILHIDPTTGSLLNYVTMPASKITSLCFAGPNLDTLYATSAFKDLTSDQSQSQPLAGSLFKITLENSGAKGLESSTFRS